MVNFTHYLSPNIYKLERPFKLIDSFWHLYKEAMQREISFESYN